MQQQSPPAEKEPGKITVTLTSDFQTWVSIPRIVQPKKFHELTVMLPPGGYDVIGRRKGYSERRKLQVSRGEARIELNVACQERELGFRHGEAAQAGARWRADGGRLPRRPEQAPADWVNAAKGLSGRFRSTEQVNPATARRWARQFEFHGDGTATLSTVDQSGAPGGGPPIKGWLALNETALTFYPFDTTPRPLFCRAYVDTRWRKHPLAG